MYCTIYQTAGKWHMSLNWPKAACGVDLQGSTTRVIGQGSSRCEKDPPIEEFCPICWKNHPHFKNKK